MVQAIENHADIEGTVKTVKTDSSRPQHRLVTVDVARSAAVQGYPNLFAEAAGKPLEIVVPAEQSEPMAVGSKVNLRVRLVGPATVFGDRLEA
jgi:hypothetical protein